MKGDLQAMAELYRVAHGRWPDRMVGCIGITPQGAPILGVRRFSWKTLSRNRMQRLYSAAAR